MIVPAFALAPSFHVRFSLGDESNQVLKAACGTAIIARHERRIVGQHCSPGGSAWPQLQRFAVTTHSVPIMPPALQLVRRLLTL
jgi:hypothetical protein